MSQLSNALLTIPLDQKLSSFEVQNYHCQSASLRFMQRFVSLESVSQAFFVHFHISKIQKGYRETFRNARGVFLQILKHAIISLKRFSKNISPYFHISKIQKLFLDIELHNRKYFALLQNKASAFSRSQPPSTTAQRHFRLSLW